MFVDLFIIDLLTIYVVLRFISNVLANYNSSPFAIPFLPYRNDVHLQYIYRTLHGTHFFLREFCILFVGYEFLHIASVRAAITHTNS